MSSDSDTATSTTSTEDKKRKSHKKHKKSSAKKHKKEKKEKRHKHKKRVRCDSSKEESAIRVTTTPQPITLPITEQPTGEEDAFGPALPPHLQKQQQVPMPIVGPVLPSDFQLNTEAAKEETLGKAHASDSDEADAGVYGPMPMPNSDAASTTMSATQLELEQRALELKIAAIEGSSGKTVEQKEREEWMLELPEVGLKSGLAALANMKRTFYQGKERPDFSDRSSWTKTPQDATKPPQPATSKSAAESLKRQAEASYEQARDEEQERIAKKHKKKHKRDESLLEIHQKKLRKEQKKREKELAASGAKPERRPFSRDIDLKLNKIDSNQTKKNCGQSQNIEYKIFQWPQQIPLSLSHTKSVNTCELQFTCNSFSFNLAYFLKLQYCMLSSYI